ncbi:MAG: TauD/TfdA family dioxygenase [Novosphingobium sp.]|nr:TauD/TfdA family dioxygenase [Novosphingobium sp.]
MTGLEIQPLREGLRFGARVRGVTIDRLADAETHDQLVQLFEQAGVLVFEDVDASPELHVAVSNIAGPLKDHLQKSVARVDQDALPGVIDMIAAPEEEAAIEIDGNRLACWLPWHFDHCYNNELNRGAALRALEVPPEGGLTGFADGISLYQALSPELRARIENCNVIYRMNVVMENFRFGRPEGFQVFGERPGVWAVMDEMEDTPRAVHPAVWTRASGEKVLHVSPWMAEGIEGAEDEEGNALLNAVCQEIFAHEKDCAYFHSWKTNDIVLWDNWRMLHGVSGHAPQYRRRLQRTTIKGDYGLGRFEDGGSDSRLAEVTY